MRNPKVREQRIRNEYKSKKRKRIEIEWAIENQVKWGFETEA